MLSATGCLMDECGEVGEVVFELVGSCCWCMVSGVDLDDDDAGVEVEVELESLGNSLDMHWAVLSIRQEAL
jgi:hypothetical protein